MASPAAVTPVRPPGRTRWTAESLAETKELWSMCRPVTCSVCGKTTWAGCGDHVAQVRAMVPAEEWCEGHGDVTTPSAAQPAKV